MNIEFDVAPESLYIEEISKEQRKPFYRLNLIHRRWTGDQQNTSRLNKIISGKNSSKKGFIEQKLDHFNSFEQRTWKQIFYHSNEFYKNNNVVFYTLVENLKDVKEY
uniref:Uncharacterized protein n=1 Tax=Ditylenchus dipsaci TaxID=166011 RepID=A0A915DQ11_9BILA